MNNDMNINRVVRSMKETRLPEVDVTNQVMQKIYAFDGKNRLDKRQQRAFRISHVWIAMCALLFIVTASVSAAPLLKTNWNGVQVFIGKVVKDTPTPAFNNEQSYKQKLETALSESTDIWKRISLDEAEQQFAFPLLRPQDSEFTLVQSFGVIAQDTNYRVKSAEEWWLGGFYDLFQWNQQDIVVKQDLDADMSEVLRNGEKTMTLTFQGDPWEKVEVADGTLAMYADNDDGNVLIVKYKTADRHVISIELEGDVAKEDLIELAQAYVGK